MFNFLFLFFLVCFTLVLIPRGLPVRFYLRKKETGHAGGRADLAVLGALGWVWGGVWLWWARWAGLGVGFGFLCMAR